MQRLYLAALKAVAFVLGHIPLGAALFLGRLLGRLAYRLVGKHREIALANLDIAYGDTLSRSEKERIARGVFENLGQLIMEFMRLPWLTLDKLNGYVEATGFERLASALDRKKGVILIASHFGNWELMAVCFGLLGYPLDIVARDLDNATINEFVNWARTRTSGNVIMSKRGSMRPLLRALSRNHIAGTLLDQNVAMVEGVFVDYFGTPACTNKGPALLAQTSGAVVMPIFIVRKGRRHTVSIGPEIEMVDTGDRRKDAVENTRRCTRAIEEMVRKHPDHWFWVHRRWKTRPEGEAHELERRGLTPIDKPRK